MLKLCSSAKRTQSILSLSMMDTKLQRTHARQLCCFATFIGAALLLVGCGGTGTDTGCKFDASEPQTIIASYMLAWKRGMNTSAVVPGVNVTYISDSAYDLVSEPSPLGLPNKESIQQWISSTTESITSGISVQLSDGALLAVNGISSKTIAAKVESIATCYSGQAVPGCPKVTTTAKTDQ